MSFKIIWQYQGALRVTPIEASSWEQANLDADAYLPRDAKIRGLIVDNDDTEVTSWVDCSVEVRFREEHEGG